MPNWCSNGLLVRGTKEEILKLKANLVDEDHVVSFDKIKPMPTELRGTSSPSKLPKQKQEFLTKKYGASNWYDWSVKNWGTKWNSSDDSIVTEYDHDGLYVIQYDFQTAWSPPSPVYAELAKNNPNINIYATYDESGNDFAGWEYYALGEKVACGEYDSYYEIRRHMEPDSSIWEYL